jgi:hypothetical protein
MPMADTDDDGFIGLPPGISDVSALVPQTVERPKPERADIVFVPTVPGMPVPAPPAPVADAPPPPPAPVPRPTASPAPAPTPPAPASTVTLVLADGTAIPVTSAALVGRNPSAFEAWPGATLVPVVDPTHSVSKTHAVFEADATGLWVHDLDSTNGVWVVHGADVTEVSPGRRVLAPVGARVELGDYVVTVAAGS